MEATRPAHAPLPAVPLCVICKLPGRRGADLCLRCKKLRDRPDRRKGFAIDKEARERQMHKQWVKELSAFRCAYTGLPLTTVKDAAGRAGPMFATWEHRDPRSPTKASEVVLVGWLINDMKTDLTESEFKRMVKALAAHFESRKANPKAKLNRTVLPRGWVRGRSEPPPD